MDLTSSSLLTWERSLNRFHSIPTSLWPPPAKSSASCACSEPWVHLPEPVHDQPELTIKDVLRETSYDVHHFEPTWQQMCQDLLQNSSKPL
ncbi:hypothetical protein TNCT_292251 [Trichonephila clavata]|uniref:Uncharacterized protein n=1 Tax=Trichonephila clavata TaxID=2740835 RepID=A0A8X6KZ51_TRICU|nr:hypothetical protein TNCT_292251 [Trichonephila clavata]